MESTKGSMKFLSETHALKIDLNKRGHYLHTYITTEPISHPHTKIRQAELELTDQVFNFFDHCTVCIETHERKWNHKTQVALPNQRALLIQFL